MADFSNFGGSEEENAEIRRLNSEVEADPDNFETWEKLVRACESLEGGLNRNSSPQALATLRDAYDRFLLKFPLLFGYWKKYADLEFNISGPESAEMVYERGCASITNSVDLWTDYCSFKMETTHVPHLVRELFERAATFVGLDFLAHPFWDKYIEYEERQEAQDKIFEILSRVIHIPMHQYARYYERFRTLSHTRPLTELVPASTLARFRAEVEAEAAPFGVVKAELEVERDVRAKIDAVYYETFQKTQTETTKRWTYEAEIKRPYFHVTELEHQQLINWRKYLDFEESEGDFPRITSLYERCLVTCAFYDEFWFRYARWMLAQPNKEEEVRNIYLRATTLFVPISRPGIRLQFAYFEEMCGRVDVARAIHDAVLQKLPSCIEAIVSWANLERRQSGLDAAIEIYKAQIDSPEVDIYTKAALVTEWAYLLWKVKGSVDEARTVFVKNIEWYADSRHFWQKWLDFELAQPTNEELEPQHGERINNVFEEMRSRSRLSASTKRELGEAYLSYLQQRGGKDAMKQFLLIDRELFGPPSVSALSKARAGSKENGLALGELDEATRQKAESRYYSFYELYADPDPNAQGPATYH
ncbi:Pre-mRNA-processing factor 39 [Pleurostoma richardsiae]|uniref:Pre-mRNA-processing factor 39 n=1 Tax=Pleurostoma richardsiae TaxID=41990 RepID=A0AA38RTK0_9PEZI|nr:Pre-mRNA-processing factor 39 [Pleurostoma richardsiae]